MRAKQAPPPLHLYGKKAARIKIKCPKILNDKFAKLNQKKLWFGKKDSIRMP